MANLLPLQDALRGNGPWAPEGGNTTIAPDRAHTRGGGCALRLEATRGGDYAQVIARTMTGGFRPGRDYTLEWYAFPDREGFFYEADLDWYSSTGTYLRSDFYATLPGPLPSRSWTRCFLEATAPVGATQAVPHIQMYAPAAGARVWVDDVYLGDRKPAEPSADGAVTGPIGSYGGYGAVGRARTEALEAALGRRFDVCVDYLDPSTWSSFDYGGMRTHQLDGWAAWRAERPGSRLVYGIPLVAGDDAGGFAGVAAGAHDAHFSAAARALVASGHADAVVMPGWEANNPRIGPWQACDDPAGFVSAFRHVVTLMREVAGAGFGFIWSSALFVAPDRALDSLRSYYPGDPYVDHVGVNCYDLGHDTDARAHSDNHWLHLANAPGGLQEFRDFARECGKPECFPEWGLDLPGGPHHGGGDDPAFVAQVLSWYAASPDLAFQSYFDWDWDDARGSALSHFPRARAYYSSRLRR